MDGRRKRGGGIEREKRIKERIKGKGGRRVGRKRRSKKRKKSYVKGGRDEKMGAECGTGGEGR